MSAKIYVTNKTEETLVATFKTPIEAFQCAALLQALAEGSGIEYRVQFKCKGQMVSRMPNPLHHLMPIMPKEVQGNLRIMLS